MSLRAECGRRGLAKVHVFVDGEDARAFGAFCARRGKAKVALIRRLVREAVPALNRRYAAAFAAQEKKISQKNT